MMRSGSDAWRGQGRQGGSMKFITERSFAIERGWLELHESGTYVKLTQAGADLFA
jgi:hypothetical protein